MKREGLLDVLESRSIAVFIAALHDHPQATARLIPYAEAALLRSVSLD